MANQFLENLSSQARAIVGGAVGRYKTRSNFALAARRDAPRLIYSVQQKIIPKDFLRSKDGG